MNPIPRGRVIITCGPSYEPIDEVRRITNHSTGKLGHLLSNRLARAGWQVTCLKGIGATYHGEVVEGVERLPIGTNEHLLERLERIPDREGIVAVFHAAALADFKVKQVNRGGGEPVEAAKISSRTGELSIVLEPAKKVIGELRALFPKSKITGWKYELAGTPDEAMAKGARQLTENRTDACVVNGRAYGAGFGVVVSGKPPVHLTSYEALCDWLAEWLDCPKIFPS